MFKILQFLSGLATLLGSSCLWVLNKWKSFHLKIWAVHISISHISCQLPNFPPRTETDWWTQCHWVSGACNLLSLLTHCFTHNASQSWDSGQFSCHSMPDGLRNMEIMISKSMPQNNIRLKLILLLIAIHLFLTAVVE